MVLSTKQMVLIYSRGNVLIVRVVGLRLLIGRTFAKASLEKFMKLICFVTTTQMANNLEFRILKVKCFSITERLEGRNIA